MYLSWYLCVTKGLASWTKCLMTQSSHYLSTRSLLSLEEVGVMVYLYSALFCSTRVPHTQDAQACITQVYLQLHQCLPLPCTRSPDGAFSDWGCGHLIAAYYSFIYPQGWKAELTWWLTYSRLFTHTSGHPSAAGRVQDRESSPVKDQSTTVPRNQPNVGNVADQEQLTQKRTKFLWLGLYLLFAHF